MGRWAWPGLVNLSTALSDGLGGFAEPTSASWTLICPTDSIVAGDLDGSGDDELVIVEARPASDRR